MEGSNPKITVDLYEVFFYKGIRNYGGRKYQAQFFTEITLSYLLWILCLFSLKKLKVNLNSNFMQLIEASILNTCF